VITEEEEEERGEDPVFETRKLTKRDAWYY